MTDYFASHGSPAAQAPQQAFAWIGRQVQAQASLLAYIDVFWVLMAISICAVPLALILRKVKPQAGTPAGH
jgi:DHA2 family multidrug resistance protein